MEFTICVLKRVKWFQCDNLLIKCLFNIIISGDISNSPQGTLWIHQETTKTRSWRRLFVHGGPQILDNQTIHYLRSSLKNYFFTYSSLTNLHAFFFCFLFLFDCYGSQDTTYTLHRFFQFSPLQALFDDLCPAQKLSSTALNVFFHSEYTCNVFNGSENLCLGFDGALQG